MAIKIIKNKSKKITNIIQLNDIDSNIVYENVVDSAIKLYRNDNDSDNYYLFEGENLYTFPCDGDEILEYIGENGISDSWEETPLVLQIEFK